MIDRWLEGGAALFAFFAAIFWFLSATGDMPKMLTYWDATPENDPFRVALQFTARMNWWASIFSGFSAGCMGVRFFRAWRTGLS
jgi:hypothetical protein